MNDTGRTLTQRVIAILRARQFLVFYSIALTLVGSIAILLGNWLATRRPLAELLDQPRDSFTNAVLSPSLPTIGLFVGILLVTTWLRAGFLRSLTGEFSLRPRDRGQFLRLLALQVLLAAFFGAGNELFSRFTDESASGGFSAGLLAMVLTVASVAVLYADYIVVLGDAGPLTALRLSARIAIGALLPSVIVVLILQPLLQPGFLLPLATLEQGLAPSLPMLLVQNLVVGSVLFVADVVLLAVFLETTTRRAAEAESV